ncbi:ribosome hibernation factor SRA [Enterobacter hormaechei]|uniref:ribosome hibernation factor SRA n=1 Tax=Enterobacter hormaechei TaxID=158836 RepID=UPI00227D741E|nr:30S ribosomal protein subunit S22 family protein [Enterobacter hormaechei]
MFTYYPAHTTAAQPELVNAIAQGLQAEHGVVTEDDILMELTRWVEATDNDILSDIYQQTYKLSNQRKVVIEEGSETQVTHATGRKRQAGK